MRVGCPSMQSWVQAAGAAARHATAQDACRLPAAAAARPPAASTAPLRGHSPAGWAPAATAPAAARRQRNRSCRSWRPARCRRRRRPPASSKRCQPPQAPASDSTLLPRCSQGARERLALAAAGLDQIRVNGAAGEQPKSSLTWPYGRSYLSVLWRGPATPGASRHDAAGRRPVCRLLSFEFERILRVLARAKA